jgi:two-component system chemotaxis sensor kinase CheA
VTYLAALRQNLARLKKDPDDKQAHSEAHRATHTLKGMSSTMRYETLAALAKRLESPFLAESPLDTAQISLLLERCDEFETRLKRLDDKDKSQAHRKEC